MAQYIDKDIIVAEIKSRIKEYDNLANAAADNNLHSALEANELLIRQYTSLLSFLDTLEVKEADLEKEANEAWDYIFSHGWDENSRMALKHDEYMAFAKHFYELGLMMKK